MDVRAVDQAAAADPAAVGADEGCVVGARASRLLALAPDADLGQLDDHLMRLRRDVPAHPALLTTDPSASYLIRNLSLPIHRMSP